MSDEFSTAEIRRAFEDLKQRLGLKDCDIVEVYYIAGSIYLKYWEGG